MDRYVRLGKDALISDKVLSRLNNPLLLSHSVCTEAMQGNPLRSEQSREYGENEVLYEVLYHQHRLRNFVLERMREIQANEGLHALACVCV